jgi:hypothetical protein
MLGEGGLEESLKEDGGSPVNAAFGVLGEPSGSGNVTPGLRCGPVYIVRGERSGPAGRWWGKGRKDEPGGV